MRKVFVIYLLALLSNSLHAQTDDMNQQNLSYATAQMNFKANRVVPPSPDAASLGKYGNVPVSLFTGTPNIQIPLYEIKTSSFSIPISLTYNASGYRPQDVASWVGLGWTLNAGGAITRSVMANPDNSDNYFNSRNNSSRGTSGIPVISDLFKTYDFIDSLQRGINEMQPDVYYYNFAGFSGKFFVGSDKKIIKKQKDNINITCQGIENDPTGVSYFQIVDENGNTFRFDQVEVSYMLLNDAIGTTAPVAISYMYPSTWYLSSVTSADGNDVVTFNYNTAANPQTMFSAFLQNESYVYNHTSYNYSSYGYEGSSPVVFSAPPIVKIYKRRYLQSITYSKGGATVNTVNLTLGAGQRQDLVQIDNPGEQRPESITINSLNGAVKKYNMFYSYFAGNYYTTPEYKRLRLDSVSEVVTDGSSLKKPVYSFVYDNSPIQSLGYGSIDHWGFSNGGTVTTLVPRVSLGDGYVYGGGAIRDPGLTGSMTAVLKQINYPTGGYTSFTYELHQAYNDQSHQPYDVGGLRIKQMIDYSFPGKSAIVKNYSYLTSDGNSSGLSYIPQYVSYSGSQHYPEPFQGVCNPPTCYKTTGYTINNMNISASSVSALGSIAGSHIGYTYVTESQTDANTGVALGKTVYHYKVGFLGGQDDDISSGDLLDKYVYDNGGKLLSQQSNTYNYAPGDGSLIAYTARSASSQDNKNTMCRPSSGGADIWKGYWETNPTCSNSRNYTTKYFYSSYTVGGQWKQSIQEVNTVYDQVSSNYIVTTKKYTYGSTTHTFPTLTEQYSSLNDEIVTSTKYAGDYIIPGSGTFDAATMGIKKLQNKNMLCHPVETLVYRQDQNGANKRYIDGTLNFYESGVPRLSSIYRLELSAPVSAITASTTNGTFTYDANFKPQSSIVYDAYGNLGEQSRSQDVVTSYKWDYNHALPVAQVVNANATMIAFASFENGSDGGGWTYPAGGINTTSGGRAGTRSYNLSATNTVIKTGLPTGKTYIVSYFLLSGATATVTTNTGTATAVLGAETFAGWRLIEYELPAGSTQVTISSSGSVIDEVKLFPKDALMTSYTYTPLVGMTSQGNAANQYAFYEYDGFSRLVNVLDMQRNIVKNYKYNYGLGSALTPSVQKMWYNEAQSMGYQKLGCTGGSEGSTEYYIVPYGRYVSSISQADANTKAAADITANGQNYVNSVGKCVFWNDAGSGTFSKVCPAEQGAPVCGGSKPNIVYNVPAHTYSGVDKAAANALRDNDIQVNGPTYADQHCWCACGGVNQKVIGGVCTTGTRYNLGPTYNNSAKKWMCQFNYVFTDGSVGPTQVEIIANQDPNTCNPQ